MARPMAIHLHILWPFEMKACRQVLRVTWTEKRSNERVLQNLVGCIVRKVEMSEK